MSRQQIKLQRYVPFRLQLIIATIFVALVVYGQHTFGLVADYELLADFNFLQSRYALAADFYGEALRHNDDLQARADLRFKLARAYADGGRFDEALAAFADVLAVQHARPAEVYLARAGLYYRHLHFDAAGDDLLLARQAYQAAPALYPATFDAELIRLSAAVERSANNCSLIDGCDPQ